MLLFLEIDVILTPIPHKFQMISNFFKHPVYFSDNFLPAQGLVWFLCLMAYQPSLVIRRQIHLRYDLTHSCRKANVIGQLESDLAYYDAAVQLVRHYTTGTSCRHEAKMAEMNENILITPLAIDGCERMDKAQWSMWSVTQVAVLFNPRHELYIEKGYYRVGITKTAQCNICIYILLPSQKQEYDRRWEKKKYTFIKAWISIKWIGYICLY